MTILRPLTFARSYATIADRKRQNSRGTRNGKNQRKKAVRGGKSGSRSGAVQRGRLRSAALSRRRKLRFAGGLPRQPARFAPLRLLFPKNLCFANLFREPCFAWFSVLFLLSFSWRVLVSAPARVSARVTSRRSRDVSEAADLFKTSTRQNPTPQTFPQLYPNFIYNKKGRALRGEKGRNYDTERTA